MTGVGRRTRSVTVQLNHRELAAESIPGGCGFRENQAMSTRDINSACCHHRMKGSRHGVQPTDALHRLDRRLDVARCRTTATRRACADHATHALWGPVVTEYLGSSKGR